MVVGAGSGRETKEIELKLEFAPTDATKIKSHPLLAAGSRGAPRVQELVSIYFDTPDLALSKRGVFLRVREFGRALRPDDQGDAERGGPVRAFRVGDRSFGPSARSRRRAGHGARATLDARPPRGTSTFVRDAHAPDATSPNRQRQRDRSSDRPGRDRRGSACDAHLRGRARAEGRRHRCAIPPRAHACRDGAPQARRQDQGRTGLRAARRC